MSRSRLGEFELMVILSIPQERDEAYANRVRETLEEKSGRSVTRCALYRTLDRLTEKGMIEWELEPSSVPERGGHPMRRLRVTEEGRGSVRERRDVLQSLSPRPDPVLDRA